MKIEIVNDRNGTPFQSLPYGTVIACEDGSGVFMIIEDAYVEGDHMNAVDLEDGGLTYFAANEKVIPLPAHLVIDWKNR